MAAADSTDSTASTWISPRLFMFAAAGVCLGLGDVWRFPHLVVEHGTAWFPLLYLAGMVLIGVPLLVGELALARLGHSRPSGNFGFLVKETGANPLWQYAGIVVLIAVFLILSYATVVAGWMIAYAVRSFIGGLEDVSSGAARVMLYSLITDSERLLGWHTLFVVALGWVTAKDVDTGVGRFSRQLVTAIFIIALLLAVSSLFKYGFEPVRAVDWALRWSDLSGALVLDAVIQAFFTLGVCMGAMMILGAHLAPETRVGSLVLGIVAVDVLFVILACMGVMPLILSLEDAGGGDFLCDGGNSGGPGAGVAGPALSRRVLRHVVSAGGHHGAGAHGVPGVVDEREDRQIEAFRGPRGLGGGLGWRGIGAAVVRLVVVRVRVHWRGEELRAV